MDLMGKKQESRKGRYLLSERRVPIGTDVEHWNYGMK